MLQRVDVQEANRTLVTSGGEAVRSEGSSGGFSTFRFISYAAWMVGAASLLGAFTFGYLSRATGVGQGPCRPDSRGCVTLDMATFQAAQSAKYASFANVFLGTGLAFSLAGAGVFTFDLLR
jgi:hypothetical protein